MILYDWLARVSKPLRHSMCQRLAPKLFDAMLRADAVDVPRPMTLFVKDYMGDRLLTGCEIGVASAINALSILKTLNIDKLYLIDPYTTFHGKGGLRSYKTEYSRAEKKLTAFKDKVLWLIAYSSDAIHYLPPKLDFAYIDGNHTYQHVKSDLRLYFEQIRHGGVIGGHDCHASYTGLMRAVVEFAQEKELDLHGERKDFWFIKP